MTLEDFIDLMDVHAKQFKLSYQNSYHVTYVFEHPSIHCSFCVLRFDSFYDTHTLLVPYSFIHIFNEELNKIVVTPVKQNKPACSYTEYKKLFNPSKDIIISEINNVVIQFKQFIADCKLALINKDF